MCLDKQTFSLATEQNFKFLEEIGYKKRKMKSRSAFCTVNYVSKISAIEVAFDHIEQHIDLYLIRLVNSKIPERFSLTDGIVAANTSDWFHFHDLLRIRSPEVLEEVAHGGYEITLEDIERILERYASALKTEGQDILQGDLSVFADMKMAVEARWQQMLGHHIPDSRR